jgi:predicted RNA-binding Zn-ribbon protein involved in translation (DUF1610 family)
MKKLPDNVEPFENIYRKPCPKCGAFIYHPNKLKLIARKYCSTSCQMKGNKTRKGKPPTNAFKPGETSGENNVNWKGDQASYGSIHDWVSYHRGKPKKCEHCGIADPSKRYEWANVSKEYKREIDDWIRLCKKCHYKYDGLEGFKEYNKKKIRTIMAKNKSGFKNVYQTPSGKFCSYITINGKQVKLGYTFATAEQAYEAYKEKALELYGEY